MLKQLKIDLRLHADSFLAVALIELGGFLFGSLILNLILRLDDTTTSWFCLGTLMALVISGVLLLFTGAFGYFGEFQLAVSMGRTRGDFMLSYALRLLLQILQSYIVVLLLYRLELAVNPLLFPGYENEVAFTFLTSWKIMVPAGLGLMIVCMFFGAVYGRFGRRGMWVFYFIWLFGCFILPRLFHDEPGTGVLDQAAFGIRTVLAPIPMTAWILLGTVLAVAMTASVIVLGKKQMVKL